MDRLAELLADNESVAGRLMTSAVVLAVAIAGGLVVGRLLAHRIEDPPTRYWTRKVTHDVVAGLTVVVLAVVWRAFAGRVGVVLGLAAAGLAFAMQEVIGALAGWFNVLSGRIKDPLTRRVLARMDEEGLEVASSTSEVRVQVVDRSSGEGHVGPPR